MTETKEKKSPQIAPLIWPALTNRLDEIFTKKVPPFSQQGKDFLIKILPYIAVTLGILSGLSAIGTLFFYIFGAGFMFSGSLYTVMTVVLLLIESYFGIYAYNGLKNQTQQGWEYLYYMGIVGLFSNFSTAFIGLGSLLAYLAGSMVMFYVIFQVKPAYIKK